MPHRKWIDNRCNSRMDGITREFYEDVDEFIQFASTQENFIILEGKLKCPYMKCKCLGFKSVNEVKRDICKYGFMKGYYYWTHHRKKVPVVTLLVV